MEYELKNKKRLRMIAWHKQQLVKTKDTEHHKQRIKELERELK